MEDQNQIIADVAVAVDYKVIEPVEKLLAAKAVVSEGIEEVLLTTGCLLLKREVKLKNIVTQGSCQSLLGNLKIFVEFLIVHIQEAFVEFDSLVLVGINVAACKSVYRAGLLLKSLL